MRRILLPALAVVVLVFVAGCGSSSGAAQPSITLYSGQHPQTVSALVEAFEKRTGISVKVRSDDEGVLASQIIQEGRHSPADVFYTENSPPLQALAQRGLLATVDGSTLAKTPARYGSPQKLWAPISARVSTMVYNTHDLKPAQLPRSVLDLAEPKWKGKLALAPSETDFQPIVTAVAARYGTARAVEWLDGLKKNAGSHVYPDNETLVAQVNSGQVELGVINHYYWFRLRDELGAGKIHSAEHFFAPGDPGYVLDVSGAGVLASSRHRAEAQRFLAFLVSRQGQEILAHSESYEYPLGSGVVTAKPLVPFASLRPDPITIAQLGDGALAIRLLRDAGLL
ncbi:MAG: iron ABC transporter substrate-binding protein [Gaiellaceae bacterium]